MCVLDHCVISGGNRIWLVEIRRFSNGRLSWISRKYDYNLTHANSTASFYSQQCKLMCLLCFPGICIFSFQYKLVIGRCLSLITTTVFDYIHLSFDQAKIYMNSPLVWVSNLFFIMCLLLLSTDSSLAQAFTARTPRAAIFTPLNIAQSRKKYLSDSLSSNLEAMHITASII